jgi:hypothetical protein
MRSCAFSSPVDDGARGEPHADFIVSRRRGLECRAVSTDACARPGRGWCRRRRRIRATAEGDDLWARYAEEVDRESAREKLGDAHGGRRGSRGRLCRDRNDESHLFNIVLFDSYEEAMENSALPVTQELSQKLAALMDGAPVFYDLDVLEDRS